MMAVMQRTLVVVWLASCGGSASSVVTSNRASAVTELIEIEEEIFEGKAESEQMVARRQAIAQARAAGILGSKAPEDPNRPLEKTSIKAAIKPHLDAIQVCYEAELLEKPGIHGTTIVDFTIGRDGSVVEVAARGFDAEVDRCVAKAFEPITFPRPAAPKVNVRYPFTFKLAS